MNVWTLLTNPVISRQAFVPWKIKLYTYVNHLFPPPAFLISSQDKEYQPVDPILQCE